MDRASNRDVLEENYIKSLCGEYHFEDLGIQGKTTLKFILPIR
jgi:hypothetical protein